MAKAKTYKGKSLRPGGGGKFAHLLLHIDEAPEFARHAQAAAGRNAEQIKAFGAIFEDEIRMVLQVLPDARQIMQHRDIQRLQGLAITAGIGCGGNRQRDAVDGEVAADAAARLQAVAGDGALRASSCG